MRISAKAEYACVAMVELASRHQRGGPISLKIIAEAYGISQAFLMQIFMQLKGAGLVTSSRGSTGGYQLARAPDQIRLSEVVGTIDGPPTATWAINSLPESAVVNTIKRVLGDIQTAEQTILDDVSLSDVVRQSSENGAMFFQI